MLVRMCESVHRSEHDLEMSDDESPTQTRVTQTVDVT